MLSVCDFRAAKERKKPDRVVFECQERAYWVVHRPPVRIHTHTPTHTQIVIRLPLHTQDTASCRYKWIASRQEKPENKFHFTSILPRVSNYLYP